MNNLSTLFSAHALMSPFWLWTIFGIVVVLLLAADLFWFNRKNEEPHFWHTLWICVAYVAVAVIVLILICTPFFNCTRAVKTVIGHFA